MPRGDPRLAPLPVRLTVTEKARLIELAEASDATLSDAARHAILVAYDINHNEVRRRERLRVIVLLGDVLGELRRIGGLYALQAKTSRSVPAESQRTLDVAIAQTEKLIEQMLS